MRSSSRAATTASRGSEGVMLSSLVALLLGCDEALVDRVEDLGGLVGLLRVRLEGKRRRLAVLGGRAVGVVLAVPEFERAGGGVAPDVGPPLRGQRHPLCWGGCPP